MNAIVLCLIGFSEKNFISLVRILDLMSKKHDFEYKLQNEPEKADIIFIENSVPKEFPKDLPMPHLILSDGRTFYGCRENQHRITWGSLEVQIGLIVNIIRHFRTQAT